MSSWNVKEFKTRSLKGYKIPKIDDLKDGDTYYLKDPFRSTMSHTMKCEHNYQKSIGLYSYYIKNLKSQIKSNIIWVKE